MSGSRIFTVFVVDDDDAVRRALSLSLASEDFNVLTFESAESFLDAYQENTYGCLVLDVRMPGIEGMELQEKLVTRGIPLPIIFVTGHASVPLSVQAIKRGAVDFLEKPFRRAILLDRIREARDEFDAVAEQRQLRAELEGCLKTLTPREAQVFDLMTSAKPKVSSKDLAAALSISPRTAEQHRAAVLNKLHVESVAELGLLLARAERGPVENYA